MHLVLTGCTTRKRAPTPPELRIGAVAKGPLAQVVGDWIGRLSAAENRLRVSDLYGGRGFQEAYAAAACLNAPLGAVSAGIGAVLADDCSPSYGLSVASRTADCVFARITDPVSVRDWWSEISARSPLGRSLAEIIGTSDGVVIVALSQAYLAMVENELASLPRTDLNRLRIVTRAPPSSVGAALRAQLMPYDDRLDGPDSPYRGTRADFASRAAHHFARHVVAPDPAGSLEAHRTAVGVALSSWREPVSFDRNRHDDDTLISIIRDHWDRADGQSSKLLRILRDDLHIACEQGRFVTLMNKLRDERRIAA